MRVHSAYWLILCLAYSTPALARRAEVLRFVSSQAPPPTETAGMRIPPDDTTNTAGLGTSLVYGFNAFAAEMPRVEPAPNGTRIPVPTWMRGDVSLPQLESALFRAQMPILGSCENVPYRPRRDFGILAETRRVRLFPAVAQIACEEGVPIGLFDALVAQESRYDISAISPKGAIGLTQLMPATARELGVAAPWDPVANLRGGARYLRSHLLEFKRVDLALAAYNAGPGRIRQLWQVPAFAETQHYVSAITRAWAGTFPRITTVIPSSLAVTPARNMRALRSVQVVTYTTATKPEVL